jgi:hypothetical protein
MRENAQHTPLMIGGILRHRYCAIGHEFYRNLEKVPLVTKLSQGRNHIASVGGHTCVQRIVRADSSPTSRGAVVLTAQLLDPVNSRES